MDLVLSSGFLAFARHCGVLAAIEERGLAVEGLCGTSSGALVGALWRSGQRPHDILDQLCRETPLQVLSLCSRPWTGLFSLVPLIARLERWLPTTFDRLSGAFGVGVMDRHGEAHTLCNGPLPAAVAASCAIPYLFAPVQVGTEFYRDGGAADRVGYVGWRRIRGGVPMLVHAVDRSAGRDVPLPPGPTVIRTPRSGARLWNLGDVEARFEEARGLALEALEAASVEGLGL